MNIAKKENLSDEMVKVKSGRWYMLSRTDMHVFVCDMVNIIKKHISKNDVIGLFLDFDNANFCGMLLYNACMACGATTIRCSISDLERQISIINDVNVDIIICSESKSKYLINRIKFKKYFPVYSLEHYEDCKSVSDLSFYELYDIPGIIVKDSHNIYCPGYEIEDHDESNLISLHTKNCMQLIHVESYIIENIHIQGHNTVNKVIQTYILLQVRTILFEKVNGNIDYAGNISVDSLGMVELLVQIEEEFAISIPIEKIDASMFLNVNNIAELILSIILGCEK